MSQQQEQTLRSELVEACRSMNRLGINRGTAGNISVRHGDGFLISPTGVPYDSMTSDHVVPMAWDGTHSGDVLPSSEWRFHRDILRARPDLNAVVHTHSTHATAVSILGRSIPPLHYNIAAAGGRDIRCAPYRTFGTQELAEVVVEAMEGRRACLLAHHGAITAHVSIHRALMLAVSVEELARLYLLCLPMGEPPLLTDEQIGAVLDKYRTYGQQSSAAIEALRQ